MPPVRLVAVRSRVVALAAAAAVLVGVGVAVALLSGGEEDKATAGSVADAVSRQLRYLDVESSVVVAMDFRYREENWSHVRTVASRLLRAYRDGQGEDGADVPPNLTGALNSLTGFAGLSFEDDVEPVLDGYLTIGLTLPPRRPLPRDLERLRDLLDGNVTYLPERRGYVRFPPARPASALAPLGRDSYAKETARRSRSPRGSGTSPPFAGATRRRSRESCSRIAAPAAASTGSCARCSRGTSPRGSLATTASACSTTRPRWWATTRSS